MLPEATLAAEPLVDLTTLLPRLNESITAEEIAALSLTVALIAFAVLAAVLYVRTKTQFATFRATSRSRHAALAMRVDRAESLLNADRQIMVTWSGGEREPDILFNADAVADGPASQSQVLEFPAWMEARDAETISTDLSQLRNNGTAFNRVVNTRRNTLVEIDGRTTGACAVLRIRDISGQRHELADLRDRHLRLSRENQSMRMLMDGLDQPAWLRDDSGNLAWVNRAFATAAGAENPDLAVAGQLDIIPADLRQEMASAREAGEMFSGSAEIGPGRRKLSITEASVRSGAAGLCLDEGASSGLKTALDREGAIRAEILDRIDTAVAVFDTSNRLTFCNRAYRDLWQFDSAWLIGKPDFEEVLEKLRAEERVPTPPDGMTWRDWVASLIDVAGGKVTTSEWDMPNASMSLRLVTIPHRDGGSTHLFHNLTESLDLQTRIRAQTRVQRQTLDSLTEAIAVFGQNGKLKLSNPRFAQMWGLDRKTLKSGPHIDTIIAECRKVHEDAGDWLALKQNVCGFLDARAPISCTMERSDDITVALSTVPLADGATLAVFTDITAAKSAEKALRERNEALEQAAELRDNFVSNVSYHLRDPLQTIIGFAQLLSGTAMTPDPAQQQEYAGYILSSSTSLMTIVNDILDLASIQANVLELDISEIDISDVINTAADALKDRITDRGVDLDIDVAPRASHMEGDMRRIRQIVFSLIANAVAFSDENGRVSVDASAEGEMIAIRVADEGQGIPARYRNRVFDSFETHDESARHRGPGLGLSLAKGFAEKHGGTIDLESEAGKGTVVTVRLPLRQEAAVSVTLTDVATAPQDEAQTAPNV